MKKKTSTWPQYVKNNKGKITQVYLPIEAYVAMNEDLEAYEKVQETEGVAWVNVSVPKKLTKKRKAKK